MCTDQVYKVKLIGFSRASKTAELSDFKIPLSCGYTAPEIFLDCPLDQSVDIWSLGLSLAFLFLGKHTGPVECDYHYMRFIVNMFGQPEKKLLHVGSQVRRYFKLTKKNIWKLRTPTDFEVRGSKIMRTDSNYFKSLNDPSFISQSPCPTNHDDIKTFLDFLSKMLKENPVDRISPAEALKHTFITMEHLDPFSDRLYVAESHRIMKECQYEEPRSDDSSLSPPAKEIGDSDKESIHSTHTDSRISLEIRPGMTIKGNSKDYLVKDIIDAGSYGEVYKCHIEDTNQFVALKFVRKSDATDFLNEVKALQRLNNLKHFKRYFIKLNDHFDFKDWFCMEFELLKENLLDFSRRQNRSLKVYEIRAIAKQMLTALRVFKQLGISHADLKPENIMLVNHEKQPFGLKLIDFGAACETEQLPDEYIIQTLGYRAPEVILGLQPDESIDMWSLGCILAELFLNYPLFPTQNEYDNLRVIMKLFGEPNKKQLEDGSLVSDYFIKQAHPAYDDITCLDDLFFSHKTRNSAENTDLKAFLDLVKKMLTVDPNERIRPADAHLDDVSDRSVPVRGSPNNLRRLFLKVLGMVKICVEIL
uniref:Protein kinase domain-containing protein n=1 Tax=Nothobranchius furzeri TaxID=105023 RepID=A0A8C6NNP4_NOTFU